MSAIDRLPPNNIEAEEALLGSLLIDTLYLRAGDRMELGIDGLGVQRQRVVADGAG
jgi:2-keto-4-pentenoate hydratase/2-oxohepta-3-ene-1,7-dioic acid hydratase in catechol pathway